MARGTTRIILLLIVCIVLGKSQSAPTSELIEGLSSTTSADPSVEASPSDLQKDKFIEGRTWTTLTVPSFEEINVVRGDDESESDAPLEISSTVDKSNIISKPNLLRKTEDSELDHTERSCGGFLDEK